MFVSDIWNCFTYIIHCEIQRKKHALWTNGSLRVSTAVRYRSFWKLISWSPPLVDEKCSFPVSVYHVRTCVFCACSRHVCVLFFFLNAYSTVDIYVIQPLWGETVFQWIAEVWNQKKKVIKMRSFYENVKWRHFRPSAIKGWHHSCCHGCFFLVACFQAACKPQDPPLPP